MCVLNTDHCMLQANIDVTSAIIVIIYIQAESGYLNICSLGAKDE